MRDHLEVTAFTALARSGPLQALGNEAIVRTLPVSGLVDIGGQ